MPWRDARAWIPRVGSSGCAPMLDLRFIIRSKSATIDDSATALRRRPPSLWGRFSTPPPLRFIPPPPAQGPSPATPFPLPPSPPPPPPTPPTPPPPLFF